MITKNKIGIYVHIPFCKKKCDYCDFISYSNKFEIQEEYINKLIEEIEDNRNLLENNKITTIYIGGGTPSAIKDELIKKVLKKIYETAKIENKEDYIDLLLEADPSKDMIHKYLNDSDVYALKKEDELISIAVILHIDRKTLELKNIVTKENYRNKGYAKTLLKSLCGNYKQKYDRMLVGTTENNIPFYVKQGFDKYEKTIKNFFIDNYKEKIKDGELTCTDLIYYSKDLKKK